MTRRLTLRLHLTAHRASSVCLAFAVLNAIFIAGTWAFGELYHRSGYDWKASIWTRVFLLQLNLASEDVAASWYASMLLGLVALASALCFAVDRARLESAVARALSWAWLAFAAAFALLSLDEMASLHERIGAMASFAGLDSDGRSAGWVRALALPIAAVGALFALFACVHVHAVPWATPFLMVGVALFFSVPLQEEVKNVLLHLARQRGQWSYHNVAIATQEGLELFGTLAFLAGTAAYLTSHDVAPASGNRVHFTLPLKSLVAILGCALAGVAAAAAAVPLLDAGSQPASAFGSPEHWPVAVAAVLVALACLQIHAEPRRTRLGGRSVYALTAVYSIGVSGYVGASLYAYGWRTLYWGDVAFHAVLAVVALVLGVRLARRIDAGWGKAAAVVWALGTVAAFIPLRPWLPYVAFGSFGVLLLSLPLHLDRRTRVE